MIKAEYLRFLQSTITNDVSEDVRKISNLVLQNIEILIPLSTAHGLRIKKIVDLAQTDWNTTSSDISYINEHTEKQSCPFTQIKSLTVGPFRGFAKQEDFDLASNQVLIYGPNGTGKSSFCEALEYGLLGNVNEAENKRFRNQNDYLKNAYTNCFMAPILIGMDKIGNEVQIIANESLYRFCFIEKNRIDSFSRIAAQAPAKQTELISTLFGLDEFSEFVSNFTDSMDRYIDIEGIKEKELNQKRQAIASFLQDLEKFPEELKKLNDYKTDLANKFRSNCTFSQMVLELNESEDGLFAQLEAELEKPISTKSNMTLSYLQTLKQSIENDILELNNNEKELSKIGQQISYKQLHEAVVKVKENSSDKCPACNTPLSQVTVNPYEYAETELKKLEHLGVLQNIIQKLKSKLSKSLSELSRILDTCCLNDHESSILTAFKTSAEEDPFINWWDSLHKQSIDDLTPWQHIEIHVKKLEDIDREIDKNIKKRVENQTELRRLRGFKEQIVRFNTIEDTLYKKYKDAEAEIEKFNTTNETLITAVESEKDVVSRNKTIAKAYYIFVQKLIDYKNSMPAQLVADLGEIIVQLYNSFNRQDPPSEQLSKIKLPLQQNQRIEISFKSDPDSFFDVLHILSEGHIRCIGLAILASKNIKENCPLLIFDDPVNAIDDDHRESIRKTMFEDDFFDNKQIILACHGEEFFKDIQNLLSAEKANKTKTIAFLPKTSDANICIDQNCAPRNYIIASRTHFEKGEIRDALDKSRKALESLTKGKIWSYVNKYGDGNLSIKLRSAKAPIELRNLTEQLKSKIAQKEFSDLNKDKILIPIQSLLGINGNSREWRYLNKGTHEEADRAEFDRQTVSDIVTALEQLDKTLI